jgi:wyosine [tRNA(Phe)-imidazoG37] synthetase (radical SAM superfamily)
MAGKAWLTSLNCEDIDIVSTTLDAAQAKLHRAHPEEREMWTELMDLLDDLHASWTVVWPAERLLRWSA